MMIPKIIHTSWFGKDPMPDEYVYYINGWKKLHPTWEVKVWSYDDFLPYFGDSQYIKDALKNKRYAFLADYFRLKVLYEFGGVYADSDVEMLKPLDGFLDSHIFTGFIFDCLVGPEIIGAEPKNPIIKDLLDKLISNYDKDHTFVVLNNWVTQYFLDNFDDFLLNGKEQHLKCGIDIYPRDYFEKITLTNKSRGGFAIHHCGGSWQLKGRPWYIRFAKRCLPKRLVARVSHMVCLRKNPFYSRYKTDKKRN